MISLPLHYCLHPESILVLEKKLSWLWFILKTVNWSQSYFLCKREPRNLYLVQAHRQHRLNLPFLKDFRSLTSVIKPKNDSYFKWPGPRQGSSWDDFRREIQIKAHMILYCHFCGIWEPCACPTHSLARKQSAPGPKARLGQERACALLVTLALEMEREELWRKHNRIRYSSW